MSKQSLHFNERTGDVAAFTLIPRQARDDEVPLSVQGRPLWSTAARWSSRLAGDVSRAQLTAVIPSGGLRTQLERIDQPEVEGSTMSAQFLHSTSVPGTLRTVP